MNIEEFNKTERKSIYKVGAGCTLASCFLFIANLFFAPTLYLGVILFPIAFYVVLVALAYLIHVTL